MPYSSKQPYTDPRPWVPSDYEGPDETAPRVAPEDKQRLTLYNFRPRASYTRHQHNPPNTILVGFRLIIKTTKEPHPGWYLAKMKEWGQLDFPFEAHEEENHAHKVLTRLAQYLESTQKPAP